MMIPISKSTMSNHRFVAGLLLMLILTTNDAFSKNIIGIAPQTTQNEVSKVLPKTTINLLSKDFLDKEKFTPENKKNNIEIQTFESFSQFFINDSKKIYIEDGVKFLSNKESFINLGVDLNQTALLIKNIGELYDSILKNEINDLTKENKMVIIKIQLSSDYKKNNNCNTSCTSTKISFYSSDKFGTDITIFSKKVRELSPININNAKSEAIAEFQIYLNTKPKNFVTKQQYIKQPSILLSPFINMG